MFPVWTTPVVVRPPVRATSCSILHVLTPTLGEPTLAHLTGARTRESYRRQSLHLAAGDHKAPPASTPCWVASCRDIASLVVVQCLDQPARSSTYASARNATAPRPTTSGGTRPHERDLGRPRVASDHWLPNHADMSTRRRSVQQRRDRLVPANAFACSSNVLGRRRE